MTAIDPEILALIPSPFLTVKPGDQVTIYMKWDLPMPGDESGSVRLVKELQRWAPEVDWIVVESDLVGVIHVARDDRTPQP